MKRLTKFEQGYICAMSCLIHGHGTGTETRELWACIGYPSALQAKKSGMCEYDVETLEICERDHGYMKERLK
jgi:hypothetical protein